MPEYALGYDFSVHDGVVNYDIVRVQGACFIGMRATISYGYTDPTLSANYAGALSISAGRLPYHVLYPGENIIRQVSNYLSAVDGAGGWDHAWPVLDAELSHNQTRSAITAAMNAWCDQVERATNKYPIDYSRAQWINDYTSPGAWRTKPGWWLASYLNDRTTERTPPPTLPAGVTKWMIHQTADKVAPPAGMMQSNELDVNRWNGSTADVRKFFGYPVEPPALPPAVPVEVWAQGIDIWARSLGYAGPRPE